MLKGAAVFDKRQDRSVRCVIAQVVVAPVHQLLCTLRPKNAKLLCPDETPKSIVGRAALAPELIGHGFLSRFHWFCSEMMPRRYPTPPNDY
ncbi:uncharacterized protein BDCG_02230 [Blastomyces dermatitidis ER-3]|uniref:Uncharacterized protein n=1 Tax=Ajellomyces dermatitidis (strain ER-3 / ATCC MYA-2586) TaxID=559297 RepID=A0ABP2ETE9_AJEDR|nr:uncharacterized protein BDCG_02230 [Blastomyces dermatitidis ER-3]EEQ87110.1 hypothetical protein BDCG_02230 [Blastomyces dermatitidis ER-3]